MPQDRIGRIRPSQRWLAVGQIITEPGDNCRHLVHGAVDVTHHCIY
jgi:hypothetical protein